MSRDLTDQGATRPIAPHQSNPITITPSHLYLSLTRLTTQKKSPRVNAGPLRFKRAPNWVEREEGWL